MCGKPRVQEATEMQRPKARVWIFFTAATIGLTMAAIAQPPAVNPWASSSWSPPPGYTGPVFKLSYDYPQQLPPPESNPPWIRALGGKPISADNAIAYVRALKDYISSDMRTLMLDYPHWDAAQRKWYDLPWLFSIQDPLYGTYIGTQQDPAVFPLSNMKKVLMTDYVVVYYNDIAGYTLGQLWGKTAMNPDLTKAQFQEGAIIIKAALTDATPDDWSPLEGSATWDIYPPTVLPNRQMGAPTKLVRVHFFQFDIIVKDTKTAPQTGWVFSTLVYDKNAPGDAWTRMVPLGAMWGNDPNFISVFTPNAPLQESVINPMAPLYSVETLGWGGRLSGPNDGAVSENNIIDRQLVPRARVSSCMSCHGVAEYPLDPGNLLPSVNPPVNTDAPGNYNYVPRPGSLEFARWFQDRPGTLPQDASAVALDYDLNIGLKALRLWKQYAPVKPAAFAAGQVPVAAEQTTQTGRPIRPPQ
jgi:hypothetical protein